uniref:Cytochrome b-c1 complex subunit 7 n=1 Tax=Meleagris gallopavo TaxID=9103 RepID=A0A803Y355_MELGA
MAARATVSGGGRLMDRIRKWYYNAAGFNKYGLMRDDTLYEDDDVKEALKRLPEDLYNERMFRIKRALDLSLKHRILPKEQWVKYEEIRQRGIFPLNFVLEDNTSFNSSLEAEAVPCVIGHILVNAALTICLHMLIEQQFD